MLQVDHNDYREPIIIIGDFVDDRERSIQLH